MHPHLQDACTDLAPHADPYRGAPTSAPAGKLAVQEARRIFSRVLQAWAMDVLRLRATGMDRPCAHNLALVGGPVAPPLPLAHDVRQAA